MSSDIEGILAIIKARPDEIQGIIRMTIERFPQDGAEITARAIQEFPDKAAVIAAAAAQAAPDYSIRIIDQAIRSNPAQANQITSGARRGNPALASVDFPTEPELSAPAKPYSQSREQGSPAGSAGLDPQQTDIEAPLPGLSAQSTVIEEPVYSRQPPPPPPGFTSGPAPAGQAAAPEYEDPSPHDDGRDRRWLTCAGIGMLVLVALICGGAATLIGANRLGFFNPAQPTSTEISLAPLDQTLTAISAEVTLTSPALEPTATSQNGQGPTETTAPEDFFPSETPFPTVPPSSPTPSSATFTLTQGAFCREGPSTIYKDRIAINAGETLPISGKGISPVDNVSVWWQVKIGSLTCFISSVLGTTSGNLDEVPQVDAPPTPTPTPTFTPSPSPTATATP